MTSWTRARPSSVTVADAQICATRSSANVQANRYVVPPTRTASTSGVSSVLTRRRRVPVIAIAPPPVLVPEPGGAPTAPRARKSEDGAAVPAGADQRARQEAAGAVTRVEEDLVGRRLAGEDVGRPVAVEVTDAD